MPLLLLGLSNANSPTTTCVATQNSNVGGYNTRGFVEVLAASQSPVNKNWFQGTADAVRQYLWLFDDAIRDGVQDLLILSGDHLYRMDYSDFVKAHRATGADITVSALPCAEKEASAFGLMKINSEGRIMVCANKEAQCFFFCSTHQPLTKQQEFAEKPKGTALEAMKVDTRVLGLDDER